MIKKGLIAIIKIYQRTISPYLLGGCRFYPSCSSYAVTVLLTKPLHTGLFLIIKRLLRCHPWSNGGFDFVPGACCTNQDGCEIRRIR